MKKVIKKKEDEQDVKKQLFMYRSLYMKEKAKLQSILYTLNKYDYLIPDEYRSIIKEIINMEGVKYHE